jgi:hypothetical protein
VATVEVCSSIETPFVATVSSSKLYPKFAPFALGQFTPT